MPMLTGEQRQLLHYYRHGEVVPHKDRRAHEAAAPLIRQRLLRILRWEDAGPRYATTEAGLEEARQGGWPA